MAPIHSAQLRRSSTEATGLRTELVDIGASFAGDTVQSDVELLKADIHSLITSHDVVVFSKSFCPFCKKALSLLQDTKVLATAKVGQVHYVHLDLLPDQDVAQAVQASLLLISGQKTVPNIFVKGRHLGGNSDLVAAEASPKLLAMAQLNRHDYDYDVFVIGGGSGGLAASKELSQLGLRVALADFVKPSPVGTQWGLGGTCVNVGCIPKKLMHQAALIGVLTKHDSPEFGWPSSLEKSTSVNWSTLVTNIQDHIGSLNWGYKVQLRTKKVTYLNELAKFKDAHTVTTVNKKGIERDVTSQNFIIAVGGRPRYPDIPGARELGITSDDLFSLDKPPGKTLLIGASYIALECAGFIKALGFDTTVMVRSILLRGFDQDMANRIGKYMEEREGINFVRQCIPTALVRDEASGQIIVTGKFVSPDAGDAGAEFRDTFDTVIFAIGRDADTASLNLDAAGVSLDAKSGKIVHDAAEGTSVDNIFAVGDVLHGKPELTPLAIKAGLKLARRLAKISDSLTNYDNVATTVFTPLEYGACGLAEETAVERFGESNIRIYHKNFWPLEWTVAKRGANDCYAKLICLVEEGGVERILGIHYLGPNAGEVIQGYATLLHMNATKADLDEIVGIHPTTAEVLIDMTLFKGDGQDPSATGC